MSLQMHDHSTCLLNEMELTLIIALALQQDCCAKHKSLGPNQGPAVTAVKLPQRSTCPLTMLVNLQVLFEAQGRGGKSKAVDLEDMKFHQCVRLARFDNDRTISFIPPDGAFDLM